jgi:hypothetical protein
MEKIAFKLRDDYKPSPELEKLSNLLMQETTNLTNQLSDRFDEAIVVGLSLRGFEFNDESDLKNFITKRCTKRDYIGIGQSSSELYVDGELFMSMRWTVELAFIENGTNMKIDIRYY